MHDRNPRIPRKSNLMIPQYGVFRILMGLIKQILPQVHLNISSVIKTSALDNIHEAKLYLILSLKIWQNMMSPIQETTYRRV